MTDNNSILPEDAVQKSMRELLVELENEPVPPRLRELAYRLEAALILARKHRKD